TAAHCAADGDGVTFFTSDCGNFVDCSYHSSTGAVHRHPAYSDRPDDTGHDVAVVTLDRDYTYLTGILPTRIGGTPHEGDWVSIVGYGGADENATVGAGQKREGTNFISAVHDYGFDFDDFYYSSTALGDSGGPAYRWSSDCEIGTISAVYQFWYDH